MTDSKKQEQVSNTAELTREKTSQWWIQDVSAIGEPARELLETYSKIPPEKVIPHVLEIREKAWQVHPYPCIGQLNFLDLSISLSPLYPSILSTLKDTPSTTILDLGCCFAQDLRKLAADGVPSKQLIGGDLRNDLIELGFELFQDRERWEGSFVLGDIQDGQSFRELEGKVDFIYAASFLHLFDWEGQVTAARRMVGFCKDKAGVVIFGRQVGNVVVGDSTGAMGGKRWRHNVESFERMWKEVGEMTGTEWRVKAMLVDVNVEKSVKRDEVAWRDTKRLRFEVVRVR